MTAQQRDYLECRRRALEEWLKQPLNPQLRKIVEAQKEAVDKQLQ
jgi:hypothetical protein